MKAFSLSLAAGLAIATLATVSAPAQNLLLSYGFNNSLANASAGTVVGTNPVGGNLTYNDASGTASTASYVTGVGGSGTALDNGSASGAAGASASGVNLGTVGSFTIAGWYNLSATPGNYAEILSLDGVGASSIDLFTSGPSNATYNQRLDVAYNGNGGNYNSGQNAAYTATSQWVFFAVTYNGTVSSNELTFYIGSTSGTLTTINSRSFAVTGDINLGSNVRVTVGNGVAPITGWSSTGTPNSPFDALIDSLVFYGGDAGSANGALSATQIDAIRQASIPVPEPGPIALAAGGLGVVALLLARRSFRTLRA